MVLNLFCFWVYSVWNSWKKVSFHDILKNEQKITKNTKKAQLLKYDCLRSSVFCNETFCVAFKHYVFVDSRYIITLCKEPKSTFSRMRQDPFHLLGKWKKNCIPDSISTCQLFFVFRACKNALFIQQVFFSVTYFLLLVAIPVATQKCRAFIFQGLHSDSEKMGSSRWFGSFTLMCVG